MSPDSGWLCLMDNITPDLDKHETKALQWNTGMVIGRDFFENFNLYLGLYNLAELFENEAFLIVFWLHFLTINLFCGSWIVKDSQKFFVSKFLIAFPLIVTYFIGPVGIFLYWVMRIFFAKKISLYD